MLKRCLTYLLPISLVAIILPCTLSAQPPGSNLYKAKHIFERLLKITPDDPDIYKYLGDIYLTSGDQKKARQYFEQYEQMRPNDYYPYYRMGDYYWAAGRKGKAKDEYRTALDLIDRQGAKETPDKLAQARMHALTGEKDLSDSEYAAMMAGDPDNVEIATAYVDTLIDTKRMKMADEVVERYLARFPNNVALRQSKARILIQNYDYYRAEEILTQLMEEDPDNTSVKTELAYLYSAMRDWHNSFWLFDELGNRFPENDDLIFARDEAFAGHRPYLRWGFNFTRNGFENHYGPYAKFVHPVSKHWQYEAGYTFERNTSSIPGYDPDYVAYTNVVDLIARYKPHWSLSLGGGVANQLVGSSYYPAPLATMDWDHPKYGRTNLYGIYNEILDDPASALFFDGKMDRIAFTYEKLFIERILFTAGYGSNWYRVDADKVGRGGGDDIGREDVAIAGLQFIIWRRPEIRLGYEFYFSRLHVENDYLDLIPLIRASDRHNIIFAFDHDWNKWFRTELSGFLGHDSKRGQSLAGLDIYGFDFQVRAKVNRRFEIRGGYQYSSEDLLADRGRYQRGFIDFLYRF